MGIIDTYILAPEMESFWLLFVVGWLLMWGLAWIFSRLFEEKGAIGIHSVEMPVNKGWALAVLLHLLTGVGIVTWIWGLESSAYGISLSYAIPCIALLIVDVFLLIILMKQRKELELFQKYLTNVNNANKAWQSH